MKNLLILIIIIGLGYFAYTSFNNSETINQATMSDQVAGQEGLEDLAEDVPAGQQGALIDLNNQIQDTLNNARNAVEQTQNRVNMAIEEGLTDLSNTDVQVSNEINTSIESENNPQ